MTRLNEPPRFGRRILPLIVAAPLMMSACAPQPTYTLYDVQPGRGWPNSGGVNYPPPLPISARAAGPILRSCQHVLRMMIAAAWMWSRSLRRSRAIIGINRQ